MTDRQPMTSTERSRKLRARRRREGYREILARLEPDASEALETLQARDRRVSISEIVSEALRNLAQRKVKK